MQTRQLGPWLSHRARWRGQTMLGLSGPMGHPCWLFCSLSARGLCVGISGTLHFPAFTLCYLCALSEGGLFQKGKGL